MINKEKLLETIGAWDGFFKRKVSLVACGGTALTLLGVKPSTKDIDLIVPEAGEYDYLIKMLQQLGYRRASGAGWSRDGGFIFDLYPGKRVHTTELIESPLEKGNSTVVKEFGHIDLSVLNHLDILVTKLFRGTSVDIEDCMMLARGKWKEINMKELSVRFAETASYDVSEENVKKNFEHFLKLLKKEGYKW